MNRTFYLSVIAIMLTALPLKAQESFMLAINKDDSRLSETNSSIAAPTPSASIEWEFLLGITSQFSSDEISNTEYALGGKVGCMMQQLKSIYITKEEIVPGDPQTRTVIKKPDIYNAVTNIERYLKRSIKDKRMDLNEAQMNLTHVIEVAFAAVDTEEADSFEKALSKEKKDASSQLLIFKKVKIKSIY